MGKYLVTLKPIEAFFFGGERVFGFYNREDKDKKLENNIIKSLMFPQQTSILGMLRKEILVIKNLIKEDWDYNSIEQEKIRKNIGKEGFKLGKEDNEQDFGVIKKISPIFIAQFTESNHRFFMKVPKDHDKLSESVEMKKYTPLEFSKKNKCKCNFAKEIYLPVKFDAKKGISDDFVDIESGEIIKNDDIFKIDSCIGINLNKNKTTGENSLFRLVKYRFNYDSKYGKADKAFAFTVELDESTFDEKEINKIQNYENVVSLGGESSCFSMILEKVDFDIEEKIKFLSNETQCYKRIVLLSDTYINNDVYKSYCEYAIANSVDFRSIRRDKYEKMNGHYYNNFEKSKNKYSFLERGSVLFARDGSYQKLIENINRKNLKKIGYNMFI